jgi:hypothetical protein
MIAAGYLNPTRLIKAASRSTKLALYLSVHKQSKLCTPLLPLLALKYGIGANLEN